MKYDDFVSFMRMEILPRREANPTHLRLDGAITGGNRDVVATFMHKGTEWVVHADTHYEPLLIAFNAAETGVDPFVEEATEHGRCLTLSADLAEKHGSQYKYLYIYSWNS